MFNFVITVQTQSGYMIFTEKAWKYMEARERVVKRLLKAGWLESEFSIYNPFN